jgi:hypothetical protein
MVDQNSAHRLGSRRKEMASAVPMLSPLDIDPTKIRLMRLNENWGPSFIV